MLPRLVPDAAAVALSAQSAPARRARLVAASLAGLCLVVAAPALQVDGSGALLAAQEAPAPEIRVAVERGALSLSVRDAPLSDVLRAIGEEWGFKVTIEGDLDSLTTRSFARVPLDEGIRQLIGDTSAVMVYRPAPDGAGRRALAEIKLYGAPEGGFASGGRAAQPMARDLAEQDPAARARSVRRLALEKGEAAAGTLAKVLAEDEDATVRVEAVDMLGELAAEPGAERSAAALAAALSDDESAVRLRAARALSKAGGSGAVAALAATLADDPDGRVRQMAAWTLGKVGGARARAALEAAADFDPAAAVRRQASSSLQHWKD